MTPPKPPRAYPAQIIAKFEARHGRIFDGFGDFTFNKWQGAGHDKSAPVKSEK